MTVKCNNDSYSSRKNLEFLETAKTTPLKTMTVHNSLNDSIFAFFFLTYRQIRWKKKIQWAGRQGVVLCSCRYVYHSMCVVHTQTCHPCNQDCLSLSHSQNQDLLSDQQNLHYLWGFRLSWSFLGSTHQTKEKSQEHSLHLVTLVILPLQNLRVSQLLERLWIASAFL